MGQVCACDNQQPLREPEDPTLKPDSQRPILMSQNFSERNIGSLDLDRLVKSEYYIPTTGAVNAGFKKANPQLRVQLSDTNIEGLEGKTTLELKAGGVYEGETQAGLPHGKGREVTAAGDEYVGQFIKGKRHGFGVFYKKDKFTYRGNFVNNKINGFGSIEYLDGSGYKGDFKNGSYEGNGTVSEANGRTKAGVWQAGTFVGEQ